MEPGWRALRIVGPLAFDLVGVIASVTVPLAAADVGVFVLSTFDTDLVLVKDEDLDRAIDVLGGAGHRVGAADPPEIPAEFQISDSCRPSADHQGRFPGYPQDLHESGRPNPGIPRSDPVGNTCTLMDFRRRRPLAALDRHRSGPPAPQTAGRPTAGTGRHR